MREGSFTGIDVFRTEPHNIEARVDFTTSGIENSAVVNEDYASGSGTLIFTNTGGTGDFKQTIIFIFFMLKRGTNLKFELLFCITFS